MFLSEKVAPCDGVDAAVKIVRGLCNIESRKDLATNSQAANVWYRIVGDYRIWQREPSVIADPVSPRANQAPAAGIALCREVQPGIDAADVSHEVIRCYGVLALAHLRAGDLGSARQAVGRALRVLSNVRLYGKALRLNRAAKDKQGDEEYHAKLFVGNLDVEVDEKTLYDTFAQFGPVLSAKVMTEADSDVSRGFGFITFDSFRSGDEAIEAVHEVVL